MNTQPNGILSDAFMETVFQRFPSMAFSAAEFVLLLSAVEFAQRLTESPWLLILKFAVIGGFAAKSIHRLVIIPNDQRRKAATFFGLLLALGGTAILSFAAHDAVGAALLQLDDKQKDYALGRIEIRRKATDLGMRHGCWDSAAAETPLCQRIAEDERAKENALHRRIFGGESGIGH
ncbi:hypothetical protein [Sphingomonas kyeonggiensis]|uniref:Uncharacterized protein n=1 Tax=Sphingomonas kyeonggiensis TaxID=1268553 RepID=A0A7W6JQ30_9SPHN|nr:hypothetical protein [Sphingomonas kyeonggiensis]MBB4097484.1 hypothetical protein [Sphingomonas kyeonggiensis]